MKALFSASAKWLIKKLGLSAGGPLGWVITLILEKFGLWAFEKLKKLFYGWIDNKEIKKGKEQDAKDLKHYDEVINKPTTNQELEDATTDLLNGRN